MFGPQNITVGTGEVVLLTEVHTVVETPTPCQGLRPVKRVRGDGLTTPEEDTFGPQERVGRGRGVWDGGAEGRVSQVKRNSRCPVD